MQASPGSCCRLQYGVATIRYLGEIRETRRKETKFSFGHKEAEGPLWSPGRGGQETPGLGLSRSEMKPKLGNESSGTRRTHVCARNHPRKTHRWRSELIKERVPEKGFQTAREASGGRGRGEGNG